MPATINKISKPIKIMRTKFNLLVAISLLPLAAAVAQTAGTNAPAPLNWSASQDHQNMMDQLGIKSLRPGAEGMNRQAPNWQNTDEAKANPYPNLPDVLTLKSAEKVTTPEMWWQKRRRKSSRTLTVKFTVVCRPTCRRWHGKS